MQQPRLPDFLVVGAARAGTTSLYEWLRAHPQVYMPPNKELEFFGGHWDRGADWYAQQFVGTDRAVAVGEATPYMAQEVAPARMAQTVPEAKLIAVLRDPIARAYSHYWFMVGHRSEDHRFDEALELEAAGAPGAAPYLGYSRYLEQLERILEHYRREQLLVLLFEDLRDAPSETYARVCQFLGVEERLTRNVGSTYNAAFRLRSYRVWFEQMKTRFRRGLPPFVNSMINRVNMAPLDYPPLDAELRSKLVDSFAEHNEELGRLIGRDLSHWSA